METPQNIGDGGTVTHLLAAAREGDPDGLGQVFELVYDQLRGMARAELARNHRSVIDATALVNMACLKLLPDQALGAKNRHHFYFMFGRALHDVLIDEIRASAALKRGGAYRRVPMVEFDCDGQRMSADAVELKDALEALEVADAEAARCLVLHCLAGRTLRDTAELTGLTLAIVRGNIDYARAWLRERFTGERAPCPAPKDC